MTKKTTARIHLLPAKEAPYVVIIRRKPSKTFHIIRWNTKTDKLEHGSWFDGHIYVKRCDVSFDGKWMVYFARGANGLTWNGVCLLPYLKTYLECETSGSWFGGGYWKDNKTLLTNGWDREGLTPAKGHINFKVEAQPPSGTEDFGVLLARMERVGWIRNGDNWGTKRKVPGSQYRVEQVGDDGWTLRHQGKGPILQAFYRGYLDDGYTFEFKLPDFPHVLDADVEWANFDALGNVVFTRAGWVHRYTKQGLRRGRPGFSVDLNEITKETVQMGK